MLTFHTSNRLEVLADLLGQHLAAQPLSNALAPETIVVQSAGMHRWLSLTLARRHGICMDVEFPFPAELMSRVLGWAFGKSAELEKFTRDSMGWMILSQIPHLIHTPAFQPVRKYMGLASGAPLELTGASGMMAYLWAQRVGELFDNYLLYRPDMIRDWEHRGAERDDWQAILWRAVAGPGRPSHFAAALELFPQRLADALPTLELPERISIFGTSSLAPAHWEILFQLAPHCAIDHYGLRPSKNFAAENPTWKTQARTRLTRLCAEEGADSHAPQEWVGNPLLSSFGRLIHEQLLVQLDLTERIIDSANEPDGTFVEADPASLLRMLQHDILNDLARGVRDANGESVEPWTLGNAQDRSIVLHSCHSPMREVEILHDQLLEMLQADPALQPSDILVLTPEIERYAPLIHAVFGSPESHSHRIPYDIADRAPRSELPTVEAFLALLDLPGSRFTASEIHALLDRAPLRAKFEFSSKELTQLSEWIDETGIRWGIDSQHRALCEVSAFHENSWAAGIDRLLLGFAMQGGGIRTFEGILPHDPIEGSGADLLNRFLKALHRMTDIATGFAEPRALADWITALRGIPAAFFPSDDDPVHRDPKGIAVLLEAFAQLEKAADSFTGPLDFAIVRHALTQLLERPRQRGGFLNGGITFCALQPLRSVPAQVICLLGLNDGAFPRQPQGADFDRIAQKRRLGDRSVRNDDRALFLELILAARARLHISYVGRSVQDNETSPPSVVVNELIDYLDQAVRFPDDSKARPFLLTEHPLQAFNPSYFHEHSTRLWSYSAENATAAARLHDKALPVDFFAPSLPEPPDEWRTVELDRLVEFLAAPPRFLLEKRLGINLREKDTTLEDDEPFSVDSLQKYLLGGTIIEMLQNGLQPAPGALLARGSVPVGPSGKTVLNELIGDYTAFHQKVISTLDGMQAVAPLPIDLPIGKFRLTGSVDGLYRSADGAQTQRIQHRHAEIRGKDLLKGWVYHLAWNAIVHPEPAATTIIGLKKNTAFGPVKDARCLLEGLLELFWEGLSSPLPFFCKTSLAYAEAIAKGKSPAATFKDADSAWSPTFMDHKECDEPAHTFCFPPRPFTPRFEELALQIYQPLLAAQHASP